MMITMYPEELLQLNYNVTKQLTLQITRNMMDIKKIASMVCETFWVKKKQQV